MALYQETSFEKLYRWTQEECRGLTSDMPDVSGALCRAVAALEDRQVSKSGLLIVFVQGLSSASPPSSLLGVQLETHYISAILIL